MRRGLQIDVLDCPRCHDRMRPVAVLEDEDVCSRILNHLKLPLRPEEETEGVVIFEVTADPVLGWDVWTQEAATRSRGPPSDWNGIDPPASTE